MGNCKLGATFKLLGENEKKGSCSPVPVWKKMLNALTTFFCCGLGQNEERPTSEVKVNGTKVKALFDTGADLTVAGLDTYKRMKKQGRLVPYYNTLTAANGQEIKSVGIARLTYNLGNYEFEHDTVILKGLKSEVIIGVDLMKKHNIVIDMGKRKILHEPQIRTARVNAVKCVCPADMWICQCAASDDNIPKGVARKNMVLEPLQASVVEIATPEGSLIDDHFLTSGLHVPQGISTCNNKGMAKILVANASLLPIQIRRGDNLCTLEKVNKEAIVSNEEWIKRIEDRILNHGSDKRGYNYNLNNVPLNEADVLKSVEEVPEKYKSRF